MPMRKTWRKTDEELVVGCVRRKRNWLGHMLR